MSALTADPATLADSYDVVIVGSGYGGAITAARLGVANQAAGGRLRIAVLERGEEHPVGSGPDRQPEVLKQLRGPTNPLGFWEILPGDAIDVVQGCGLGGTSLNNMNASVVPDREVFLAAWPAPFHAEVDSATEGVGGLGEYFDRARRMLGAYPYRTGRGFAKAAVFDEIARLAGATTEPVHVNVNAENRVTRYGVKRSACTNCGDCCMVCNVGAKNTLAANYLPMAKHFGAALFTRVEVSYLEHDGDGPGYRISCVRRSGPDGLKTSAHVITAQRVVLSAGALGSTAILLRSRDRGMVFSDQLGEHFSGNGDSFATAHNTDRVTDAQGFGTDTGPRASIKVGPSITSMMRFGADQPELRKRFTVQDLTPPRALVDEFRLGFGISSTATYPVVAAAAAARRARDPLGWNTDGAMNHTVSLLIMAHDTSDGRIVLDEHGAPQIDWPSAPSDHIYKEIEDILTVAVRKLGGRYLHNPRWGSPFLGNNLMTAHPLGGCATADDPENGSWTMRAASSTATAMSTTACTSAMAR